MCCFVLLAINFIACYFSVLQTLSPPLKSLIGFLHNMVGGGGDAFLTNGGHVSLRNTLASAIALTVILDKISTPLTFQSWILLLCSENLVSKD